MRFLLPLPLLLVACGPVDGGGDGLGTDTDVSDSDVIVAADCAFGSIDPTTVSRDGGALATLVLDCADPTAVGTLEVQFGDEILAVDGGPDGSQWVGTFTTPPFAAGVHRFDILVDGELADDGELRFHLPGYALDERVDLESSLVLDWKLPAIEARVLSTDGAGQPQDVAVISRSASGAVVWGSTGPGRGGRSSSGMFISEAPPSAGWGPDLVAWSPIDGAPPERVTFLMPDITPDGLFRVGALGMRVDGSAPSESWTSIEIAKLGARHIGTDLFAAGHVRALAMTPTFDEAGQVKALEAFVSGTSEGGAPFVALLASDKGSPFHLVWKEELKAGANLRRRGGGSLHLGELKGTVHFVDDWQGETAYLRASYRGPDGAPIADVLVEGFGDMADLTMGYADLDGDGEKEIVLVGVRRDGSVALAYTPPGKQYLSFQVAGRSPFSLSSGAGDVVSNPQITALDNASIQISVDVARDGQTSTVAASWYGDGTAVDLESVPSEVGLTGAGGSVLGRHYPCRGPYTCTRDVGISYRQAPGGATLLTTLVNEGLTLGRIGGWELVSRDGMVQAIDPNGLELAESLPIDPTSHIDLGLLDGRLVVGGLVATTSPDGETVLSPGIVVASHEGVGQNLFEVTAIDGKPVTDVRVTAWDFSGNDFTAVVQAHNGGGFGTAVTITDSGSIALIGARTVKPNTIFSWGTVLDRTFDPGPVFLDQRDSEKAFDGAPLTSFSGVKTLGAMAPQGGLPDMVLRLPVASDTGCDLGTWYVPGISADPAKNFANAILLDTGSDASCSDLAAPGVALDADGDGASTAVLVERRGDERLLWELVWDGSSLLRLPEVAIDDGGMTANPAAGVAAEDLDGDGYEDLYAAIALPTKEGAGAPPSGLMLRGGGFIARGMKAEVRRVVDATLNRPMGGDGLLGVELLHETLDSLAIYGTYGATLAGPPPGFIRSAADPEDVVCQMENGALVKKGRNMMLPSICTEL